MAKQQVVEVQCDRCKRKEYRSVTQVEVPKTELELDFRGMKIKFDDLCEPCRTTISNYVDNIKKAPKGKSPKRRAKKKDPSLRSGPFSKTA